MKQKRIKQGLLVITILLVLAASASLVLFLYQPSLFIQDFNAKAESMLSVKLGEEVTLDSLSGNFIDGFRLFGISIGSADSLIMNAEYVSGQANLWSLIAKRPEFQYLSISNGFVDVNQTIQFINSVNPKEQDSSLSFEISDLTIQDVTIRSTDWEVITDIRAELTVTDSIRTVIQNSMLEIPVFNAQLDVKNCELGYSGSKLQFSSFDYSGVYLHHQTEGVLDGYLDLQRLPVHLDFSIQGQMDLDDYQFPELSCQGTLGESRLVVYNGMVEDGFGKIAWDAMIDFSSQNWTVSARSEEAVFPIDDDILMLAGGLTISGQEQVSEFDCSLNLDRLEFNTERLDSVQGMIHFSHGHIINKTALDFRYQSLHAVLDSLSIRDFRYFDVSGHMYGHQFSLNNLHPQLPEVTTSIGGDIRLSGDDQNQQLTGTLALDSLRFDNYSIKSAELACELNLRQYQLNNGTVSGDGEKFSGGGFQFENIGVKLELDENLVSLSVLEGSNPDGDSFLLSGEFENSLEFIHIDSLNARIHSLPFETRDLLVRKEGDRFYLEEAGIRFGSGLIVMSGDYRSQEEYQLSVNLQQISMANINTFFDWSHRFRGIIDGDVYFSQSGPFPVLLADLRVMEGQYDDISFISMEGELTYRDGRLVLNNCTLFPNSGGRAVFSGVIPLSETDTGARTLSVSDTLSFSGSLSNFQALQLNRYFPWTTRTAGLMNGTLDYRGPLNNPVIAMELDITDPEFDRIMGNSLSGRLYYEDRKMFLRGLQLRTDSGNYTATGFLPSDLSMPVSNRQRVSQEPISIMLTGRAKSLELLLPYFTQVDSLNGNVTAQLSIAGNYANPVRNGQIIIQDGTISVLALENSITNVNGYVTIDDNQLMIRNLSGLAQGTVIDESYLQRIRRTVSGWFNFEEKAPVTENVFFSGGMDMTEFFLPVLDLKVTGENIYLASSEALFKGIGQAELAVTGKDTVEISGEFIPNPYEFIITTDFEESEAMSSYKPDQGDRVFVYDIHLPLDNVIKLENNFADLELDGDLNFTATGSEDLKTSGTLNIIDGIAFINGNEYQTIEGSIIFDPLQKVPNVDIEAVTTIGGYDFRIYYIGAVDDVSINVQPEDPSLLYSEDDILQILLTQELETAGDENVNINAAGQNILSNYIENQFGQFIEEYSPVDRFRIQGSGAILSDFDASDINLYVGKNLTRKLSMNIRSDVFANQITSEYEVVYRINRYSFVVARLDEEGLPHLNYRIKFKY